MNEEPLRLYAYKPIGHGPYSYFVMARSEQAAIDAIKAKQQELNQHSYGASDLWSFEKSSYQLTILNENQAIENENE